MNPICPFCNNYLQIDKNNDIFKYCQNCKDPSYYICGNMFYIGRAIKTMTWRIIYHGNGNNYWSDSYSIITYDIVNDILPRTVEINISIADNDPHAALLFLNKVINIQVFT